MCDALRSFKIRKILSISATSEDFAINWFACATTLRNSSFVSAMEQQNLAFVAASSSVAAPSMWSSCQCVTTTQQTELATSTPRLWRYESATGCLVPGLRQESTTAHWPSPMCVMMHSPRPGPNSDSSNSSDWGGVSVVTLKKRSQLIRPRVESSYIPPAPDR